MSAPAVRVGIALSLCALPVASAQGLSVPVDRSATSGAIAGRVCHDDNGDGVCQAGEPGVPGLRLVMETGQQALTDPEGRYHLAAVAARFDDALQGGVALSGRHRLKVDGRGLRPGAKVVPEAVTLEVPSSGLVLQNFAVQEPVATASELRPAWREAPPAASVSKEGEIAFQLSGRASPRDVVTVAGVPVQTSADGTWRAQVGLRPGGNDVSIEVASKDGAVRLFTQHIDVVRRAGGVLVIPREPRPTARLQLPGSDESPASSGTARVRVEGPKGTVIGHPGGELVVGEGGAVDVPVELLPGQNLLPLRIQRPGEPVREAQVRVEARARPFVVALLDAEVGQGLSRSAGGLRLIGRGAAHAELPLGRWSLLGELDLRDQDLRDARSFGIGVLAAPRDVLALERALDPERTPYVWADESTSVAPNEAGGRVRLELSHPDFGGVGFGTLRARFADGEIGRYHRELFGAWARVHTPASAPVQVAAEAFASNGAADPATGLVALPAHAEFTSTGGSLFYLPHGFVSRGSERVRIVTRDGLTGVPIAERHLTRGVDYEIDADSGRIVLGQPLAFAAAPPRLATSWPTEGAEPVLVVDYEYVDLAAPNRAAAGGEASAHLGPVTLRAGGVSEGAGLERYRLVRGGAAVRLFGLTLSAEAAQSAGRAHAPKDVAVSPNGGLEFLTPYDETAAWTGPDSSGWALSVRLAGDTFAGGHVDASWRRRTPEFSDETFDARGPLTQLSATVEQPLGPVVVGFVADDRTVVDPRDPFGRDEVGARTLGGYVGYRGEVLQAQLEAKDAQLVLDPQAGAPDRVEGARTSVGASLRYRVAPGFWIAAGHRQAISTRGAGPGAFDDTFTSAGVDLALNERTQLGVRGGWGPRTGPLAWATGQYTSGGDTFYGSYSVDVDGPDFGEHRVVSGARTRLSDGTTVFVEDVGAHDATSVRIARAVGVSSELAPGLSLSARYERGARSPIDVLAPLRRDAGGVSVSFVRDRLRLYGRAETRFERGHEVLTPLSAPEVDRIQQLASAAATFAVLDNLHFGGRLNWSTTHERQHLIARLVEASAGLTWRSDPLMVVLHYGIERELSPLRADLGEQVAQRVSVMPSLKLGDRFAIAAGAHAGWFKEAAAEGMVLSASLRPSVRVVGGLEVAAELARRSSAPDGGRLDALRGEVGYRFGEELMLAGGYTLYGFSGLGLTPDDGDAQRVYVRAEAAW
ncbi:MAG: flagellar motor protein [Myxococcaceae bacterium]|nr:flagellar motor protein [Myxococcaceae bacterium]